MRLMSSLLFKVSPMDPATYIVATTGVVTIAWLACHLPSRRAAGVNPVNALRAEWARKTALLEHHTDEGARG
jgi:ABC-type lipoprotein release transport system permease subunit